MVVNPTFFYLDDQQIGDRHYRGNTVPDANKTIGTATNTSRKRATTRVIHSTLKSPIANGILDDPNGDLNEWALEIYGRIKDGKPARDPERDVLLAEAYFDGLGTPAIYVLDQVSGKEKN